MSSDDFERLNSADHYLEWLGEDPPKAIRRQVERMLQEQVAGSVLRWIRVSDAPYFLTGGRKMENEPTKVILTRAGLALPFQLEVRSPEGTDHALNGVFSWVATHLDAPPRKDQCFFDLDVTQDWAAEQLKQRLYEVGAESRLP
jgi:hypothetical protein